MKNKSRFRNFKSQKDLFGSDDEDDEEDDDYTGFMCGEGSSGWKDDSSNGEKLDYAYDSGLDDDWNM